MPAPTPAAVEINDDDEGQTVILSARRAPLTSLQRVKPPGRSDVITLQRSSYTLGRAPQCDIPLFSATASRDHAELINRDDRWYVRPQAGKSVVVDGTAVKEEAELKHKMRLQFGEDELIFFDESAVAAPSPPADTSPAPGVSSGSNMAVIIGAVVAAAVAVALALWLLL